MKNSVSVFHTVLSTNWLFCFTQLTFFNYVVSCNGELFTVRYGHISRFGRILVECLCRSLHLSSSFIFSNNSITSKSFWRNLILENFYSELFSHFFIHLYPTKVVAEVHPFGSYFSKQQMFGKCITERMKYMFYVLYLFSNRRMAFETKRRYEYISLLPHILTL